MGNANDGDPTALLSKTPMKAIIVKAAYRLNIFGFIACSELLAEPINTEKTVGNLGFWDLRLALEWTRNNINYFHGNPSNVTIGGYSAGAHAAFYQLAYDLESPPERRIIKRIVMHSNGPGVQPKSLDEVQLQFNELLKALKIPKSMKVADTLKLLRSMEPKALLKATKNIQFSQFRAVTDGVFVRHALFQEIADGTFACKMLESNVHLLMGECSDEHFVYGRYRTPKGSHEKITQRLEADYARKTVQALSKHYFPGDTLPPQFKTWQEAFGKVYADVQIHVTQRGFIDTLIKGGAGPLIQRYRIEWRSKLSRTPAAWGATHGGDQVIWFFGYGKRLDSEEQKTVNDAFMKQFSAFVMGQTADWGTQGPMQARRLCADGTVDIWEDDLWEEKLAVWKVIMDATLLPKASL